MHTKNLLGALTLGLSLASHTLAADLNVYGPGGPAPAMKQAAAAFSAKTCIEVQVTAGPTADWKDQASQNADLIYSGSEHMMNDFAHLFEDPIDINRAMPLYLRSSAILVRPGNPKGISGFKDLLTKDVKVLVVAGAGQTGLWEDVAGRAGRIADVRALRSKLVLPGAGNSGIAKQQWETDPALDAWLIWDIWQVANPQLADLVVMEPEYRIWRSTSIVATRQGETRQAAADFVEFLLSDEGKAIFASQGWLAD